MKVMLTGSNGQLGRELVISLINNGHDICALNHSDLDIVDKENIKFIINDYKPDIIINTAAYTNVEKAETEQKIAFEINAIGAKNLSEECFLQKIPLIHFSTDYVFENKQRECLLESDETNPLNTYGRTKLQGEIFIKDSGCKYLIFRTSWVFGRFGSNFVKTMLNLTKTHNEIKVVNDQIGGPTPARALAEDISKKLNKIIDDNFTNFGIYHYSSNNYTTWDKFASKIFQKAKQMKIINNDIKIIPISSKDFKTLAKRPQDSRLCTKKIVETFNFMMPNWDDYLEETILSWKEEQKFN